MRNRALLAVVALLGPACERSGTPVATSTGPVAAPVSIKGPLSDADASDAGAPGRASLAVIGPGAVELRNATDAAVRISWNMAIEREGTPAATMPVWNEAQTSTMTMTPKCLEAPPADGCVTVQAHGTYKPMPWRGWIGCTQCLSCKANVPAAPGTYRIVAFECKTGARYESEPVVIVEPGRFAGTAGDAGAP